MSVFLCLFFVCACAGAPCWGSIWTGTGPIPLRGLTPPCTEWRSSSSTCTTTRWVGTQLLSPPCAGGATPPLQEIREQLGFGHRKHQKWRKRVEWCSAQINYGIILKAGPEFCWAAVMLWAGFETAGPPNWIREWQQGLIQGSGSGGWVVCRAGWGEYLQTLYKDTRTHSWSLREEEVFLKVKS